jgi:catechol 2,3-dioxygenase-like lactoylglutathione lyase family enzyme
MARIRHLAIVSENRERLVRFYTEAFGMKVIDGVGPAIYRRLSECRDHSEAAAL